MVDGKAIGCVRDAKLRGLEVAMDLGRMQGVLDRAHAELGGGAPAGSWLCRVLRHHPGSRAVLLYHADGAPVRLVGKLYAKPGKAAKVWSVLVDLAAHAGGATWRTPRPLARLPEWNLLLMEHLEGVRLCDVVWDEEPWDAQVAGVRRAARALALLHRVPADALELRTMEGDRAKLARQACEVDALAPDLARRIAGLSEEIARRAARLAPAREGLLHGSVSPKQLLLGEATVAFLDFDGACRGDPAIDVGTLMAVLHKYSTKVAALARARELAELALEAYASGSQDSELAARARLVRCQQLIHFGARARLAAARRAAGAPGKRSARLLEEAEACLALS